MKKGDFGRPFLWARYFKVLCFLKTVVDDGFIQGIAKPILQPRCLFYVADHSSIQGEAPTCISDRSGSLSKGIE